jgi:hypothetical protein
MDIHTAEPLVPEPILIEVEIAIGKLKSYKSPDTHQIPAKLIRAGGEMLCPEIHKLILSILNKKELPQQWKESIMIIILQVIGHLRSVSFQNLTSGLYESIWTFDRTHWTGFNPTQDLYLHRKTTQKNTDIHPCPERDSNPRSQCSSSRRQYVP